MIIYFVSEANRGTTYTHSDDIGTLRDERVAPVTLSRTMPSLTEVRYPSSSEAMSYSEGN